MQSIDASQTALSDVLRAARYARGISIRSAADEIGVSTSQLIRVNRGDRVTAATIRRIREWCEAQDQPEVDTAEWRSIPGWEGFYEASSRGEIRSVERVVDHPNGAITIAPRILRPSPHDSGHLRVCLSRDHRYTTQYVHTLVLEAFHGLKPFPDALCRHLNGIETDNRPENLRWGTYGENRLDTEWHYEHPGEVRAA